MTSAQQPGAAEGARPEPGTASPPAPASSAGAPASLVPLTAPPPPSGAAAWLIGTLCGVGHFPIASGTAGSAAALGLWYLVHQWGGHWLVVAVGAALAFAGTWAAGRIAASRGIEDPSEVVIDEAAGMFLSLAFLPAGWEVVAAAFVLFRILDVTKPWPAARAERIPGGLGIMADDLIVGLYTNLLVQVAAAWVPA